MCGRYATGQVSWEQYRLFLNLVETAVALDVPPHWNIAPTVPAPIALDAGQGRMLALARWGIWQPWMEGKTLSTFNARAEGLSESRLFSPLLTTGRCLVPAQGFYEWTGPKGARTPHFIHHPGGEMMVFAGLWARAMKEDEDVLSFTLITTSANDQMQDIHHRMPVILTPDSQEQWMAPGAAPLDLLKPFDGHLDIYPVDPLRGNSPGNLKPRAQAGLF